MNLTDQVALVTGAGRRVGRAISLELARAGCSVAVHFHTAREEADSLVREIRELGRQAVAIGADLTDPLSWSSLIRQTTDTMGGLGVLVNNASRFSAPGEDELADFDGHRWAEMLQINLTAPVGLVHHAAPWLRRSRGRVVNLLDASLDTPWRGHLSYSASKAGLATMTRALARVLAPEVQVFGVSPGIAIFPEEFNEETRSRLVERVPLQREGGPQAVAVMVRALLEHGDYVTGEIIRVDGGRFLG
ncbi:MAG: SDR family NAD(P)-dependent oxidoreductase [Planctomycetota bacterium]|jgi:NAD(P)-dependent dehydrogenase (short-subunit alcohol dehydrogenase family)